MTNPMERYRGSWTKESTIFTVFKSDSLLKMTTKSGATDFRADNASLPISLPSKMQKERELMLRGIREDSGVSVQTLCYLNFSQQKIWD